MPFFSHSRMQCYSVGSQNSQIQIWVMSHVCCCTFCCTTLSTVYWLSGLHWFSSFTISTVWRHPAMKTQFLESLRSHLLFIYTELYIVKFTTDYSSGTVRVSAQKEPFLFKSNWELRRSAFLLQAHHVYPHSSWVGESEHNKGKTRQSYYRTNFRHHYLGI